METASLNFQKEGVVLSGTTGNVILSDARKAPHRRGRCEDIN